VGRSWNELRLLAADRQKWKETHRQPMFLKEQWTLLLLLLLLYYESLKIQNRNSYISYFQHQILKLKRASQL
jgi:hypothetical protein